MSAAEIPPATLATFGFRLIPKLFFSANSPPPHSAPNAATSPFYKNPGFPFQVLAGLPVVNPNAYPALPVSSDPMQSTKFHRPAPNIRVEAITSSLTSRL